MFVKHKRIDITGFSDLMKTPCKGLQCSGARWPNVRTAGDTKLYLILGTPHGWPPNLLLRLPPPTLLKTFFLLLLSCLLNQDILSFRGWAIERGKFLPSTSRTNALLVMLALWMFSTSDCTVHHLPLSSFIRTQRSLGFFLRSLWGSGFRCLATFGLLWPSILRLFPGLCFLQLASRGAFLQ